MWICNVFSCRSTHSINFYLFVCICTVFSLFLLIVYNFNIFLPYFIGFVNEVFHCFVVGVDFSENVVVVVADCVLLFFIISSIFLYQLPLFFINSHFIQDPTINQSENAIRSQFRLIYSNKNFVDNMNSMSQINKFGTKSWRIESWRIN